MKGRIDINQFVALTSTNHAKLYGLYPRKGTIAIGADADIALWDPDKRLTLTNDLLQHGADYTPYEGLDVRGWPVCLLLRGKTVVADGQMAGGTTAGGAYLARKKSSLVRDPAL
jgi:dihydropyrimidinase